MRAYTKASLILLVLLSIFLFHLSHNHTYAQDFLKKFLSSSLIEKGKLSKTEGDYVSAITELTKSIKRNPENLEAYYELGLILEEVLHDYDKAISLYKNVITLSEGIKPKATDEELKEFNSLITNTRRSIDRAIEQKFESIEKPKVPVYIMVKPYEKILKEPKMFSYSIYKTTGYESEFRLLDFSDNWYQINVPSAGSGWVNGKDVLKIIQKEKDAIETTLTGKAALYERFADLYPDSVFAHEAKERADNISYEFAEEEDSINSYSNYLKKYPDGKHAKVARLKLDTLTIQDESFFNNIDRLKHWIGNNPESTFIEKAKKRTDELAFAQAKYDNNIKSLELYIDEFPQGKFVADAKQIIEEIKYNQAKFKDTIDSYRKYLDEYPNGKYVDDAIRRIDEKEFSSLLNSQDIDLLTEHLKNEVNEKRIGLVKNRIEELYYKKADKASNDAEAIKMYEDYMEKYPDGPYAQESKPRIEELSFNIAGQKNSKESYNDFIRQFPESKYYQKAIDSIEVLEFNIAKGENTIESFEKFIMLYQDGKLFQMAKNRIEELALEEAKDADTIEAYENFVKEYPDSHLNMTAKDIIETKYFENASQKGTVEAYKEYIILYPDGSHVGEAKLKIDKLTFEPYKRENSVRGFKKFIKKYPDNRFVKEARTRIDQLNFEYYQKKNTVKAYKKFISKFPENRFVRDAEQEITQLTLVGGKRGDNSNIWIWIILLNIFVVAIITSIILMRKGITKKILGWQTNDWRWKLLVKDYFRKGHEVLKKREKDKKEEALMKCPKCGIENLKDTKRCGCGYEFSTHVSTYKMTHLISKYKGWFLLAVSVCIIFILYSELGPKIVGKKNRQKLEQLGIKYNEVTFIEKAGAGDKEAVELFLKSGIRPNSKNSIGQTALMFAAQNGHIEICKALVKTGGDSNIVDENGKTALIIAAEKGYTDIVKTLTQNGANLINKSTALCFAAANGHTEIVMFFIKNGIDVNIVTEKGRTPLTLALDKGYPEIANALIHAGANVKDRHNKNALLLALNNGHTEVAKALIKAGADINAKTISEDTALILAINKGYTEIAKALIQAGADINVKTYVGITEQKIFFSAIYQGFTEVVKAFIKAGANVNIIEKMPGGGYISPLGYAIYYLRYASYKEDKEFLNARIEIVKVLVDAGVDLKLPAHIAVTGSKKTALGLAIEAGQTEIIKILQEAGAKLRPDFHGDREVLQQKGELHDIGKRAH